MNSLVLIYPRWTIFSSVLVNLMLLWQCNHWSSSKKALALNEFQNNEQYFYKYATTTLHLWHGGWKHLRETPSTLTLASTMHGKYRREIEVNFLVKKWVCHRIAHNISPT